MQFFCLDILLILERQPVFSFHGLAYDRTPDSFVMASFQLCIILHPVMEDVS